MRRQWRPHVFYTWDDDGAIVKTLLREFPLGGRSAFRLLESLSPFLTGRHDLVETLGGLAHGRSKQVLALIEHLDRAGAIIDPSDTVSTQERRLLSEQQASVVRRLEAIATSPAESIRTLASTPVLVVVTDRCVGRAIMEGLEDFGVERASLVVTGICSADGCHAEDSRDEGCSSIVADNNGGRSPPGVVRTHGAEPELARCGTDKDSLDRAVKATDAKVLVHISTNFGDEVADRLADICRADGRALLHAGGIESDLAISWSSGQVCLLCIRRRVVARTRGHGEPTTKWCELAVAALTAAVCDVMWTHLGLVRAVPAGPQVEILAGDLWERSSHQVAALPSCGRCSSGWRLPHPPRTAVEAPDRRVRCDSAAEETASDQLEGRFLVNVQALSDAILGVVHDYGNGSLQQVPYALHRANGMVLDRAGGFRDVGVTAAAPEAESARALALRTAMQVYVRSAHEALVPRRERADDSVYDLSKGWRLAIDSAEIVTGPVPASGLTAYQFAGEAILTALSALFETEKAYWTAPTEAWVPLGKLAETVLPAWLRPIVAWLLAKSPDVAARRWRARLRGIALWEVVGSGLSILDVGVDDESALYSCFVKLDRMLPDPDSSQEDAPHTVDAFVVAHLPTRADSWRPWAEFMISDLAKHRLGVRGRLIPAPTVNLDLVVGDIWLVREQDG